jgi:hypothetical protein
MVLRGPGGNKTQVNVEDSYLTERPIGSLNEDGEVDIPESVNVKECLLAKLEEIDFKINHLYESNKFFLSEMEEAETKDEKDEFVEYIKENEDLVLDKKNQVIKICNAFMKAGINLELDVYPKLKYKSLYLPEF